MSSSDAYTVPIVRPNTTNSISHDPAKDRHLSLFAIQKQKATKRSIILEIIVIIFVVAYTIIHFVLSHGTFLLYSLYITGIISLIATFIWICFEIHKKSFISLLKSFRGFVITFSVSICIICDILRIILTSQSNNIIETIINDFVWLSSLFLLISSDCVPSITIITRFIGPIFAMLNAIKTLLIDNSNSNDIVIIKSESGDITINQIQQIAVIQMILFGGLFVFAFLDIKHKYFVILDDHVLTKKLLPLRDYAKEDTFICDRFAVKTSWIFVCFTICGVVSVGVFIWNYISQSNDSLWCVVIVHCVACVLILILLSILCWNHFDKSIIKHLLPQFRYNLLLVSMIVIFYCQMQELIWKSPDLLFVIDVILNTLLYSIHIIFLITGDIMKISYPMYFKILVIFATICMTVWNLYMCLFNEWYDGFSKWFVLLKREAYLQVIILCVLMLWNMLISDRKKKYFVLIRERKPCKELFYDESEESEFANDLVMNNDDIL